MLLREQLAGDQPDWMEAPGNITLARFASSCPVDACPQGSFFDLVGNVWQWTSTAIDGFEGFEVHPLYDDFSTPTFDGKHSLIKGGSWISTGTRRSSRPATPSVATSSSMGASAIWSPVIRNRFS